MVVAYTRRNNLAGRAIKRIQVVRTVACGIDRAGVISTGRAVEATTALSKAKQVVITNYQLRITSKVADLVFVRSGFRERRGLISSRLCVCSGGIIGA